MFTVRLALVAAAALALAGTTAQARGGAHGGGYSYGGFGRSAGHVSSSDHLVSGYTRSNGTYVHSYHATNPNGTRNDNYSTRGNVNPYTGVAGTKPRDGE